MQKTSRLAITSLVLGVIGLFGFVFSLFKLGLIALIIGIIALFKIKKYNLGGLYLAIAGIVLGIFGVILLYIPLNTWLNLGLPILKNNSPITAKEAVKILTTEEKIRRCEINKNTDLDKSACYEEVLIFARQGADTHICDLINLPSIPAMKENCLAMSAEAKSDTDICTSLIKNVERRDFCYSLVAVKTKNRSLCSLIQTGNIKRSCIALIK